MANLILTHRCTLRCDYCFAADFLQNETVGGYDVSFDIFEAYIDFLDRSGLQEVRLLGGEPTLHREFIRFVKYARTRGKKVQVFSNGLIPQPALEALMEFPPEQCTVLINLASGKSWPDLRRKQLSSMKQLAQRACPGYTISGLPVGDLQSLLDMIDESGCQPSLRIALAQPAVSQNKFVHPKQYRALASSMVALAAEACRKGVHLEFDCGFVRCMFSDEDVNNLHESGVPTAWRCSPVMDIDIDGTVVPCFALSSRTRIRDGMLQNAESLRKSFHDSLSILRVAGVYPECSTCGLRVTEGCSGGCLAAALRRLKNKPVTYTLNAQDTAAFMKM